VAGHSGDRGIVGSSSGANPTKFRDGAYSGSTFGDGATDSLDRTNEGYFEILEMGTIMGGSSLETSVTHVSNLSSPNASTPPCTGIPTGPTNTFLVAPSGGLMGTTSLINVNEGTDYSYDAIALDGWSSAPNWTQPGSQSPTLIDITSPTSVVIDNSSTGGRVYRTVWAGGSAKADAVSAIMMRSHVYNEYTVETGIKAATDWVVTMPTKRFYVTSSGASRPFQSKFSSTGSCDSIDLIYYDREEQSPGAIIDFSPTTPETRSLCWEANVLTFTGNGGSTNISNVLRSTNMQNVALLSTWINGWADLSFPASGSVHTLPAPTGTTTIIDIQSNNPPAVAQTVTYFGLPVVGFAVQSYSTTGIPGVSANVLSNYGGNFNHKYLRTITTQVQAQ